MIETELGATLSLYPSFCSVASFITDNRICPVLPEEEAAVFTVKGKPVTADNFFERKSATLFDSSVEEFNSILVVFFKTKKPAPVCSDTGCGITAIELFCAEAERNNTIMNVAIVNFFMSIILKRKDTKMNNARFFKLSFFRNDNKE